MISIKVSNSTCTIVGEIDKTIFSTLRTLCSYRVDGTDYDELLRQKYPDGRNYVIDFASKTFATGLLPRVISDLENMMGEQVILIDERVRREPSEAFTLRPEATLRPYQQQALNDAVAAEGGVIRVATGGGKTRIGAALIVELERPALFLVNRVDLLRQAYGVFKELLLDPTLVGQIGGGVCDPREITVATVQSLLPAMGEKGDEVLPGQMSAIREMIASREVVIVDEAHCTSSASITTILRMCQAASFRYGLSATDWRDDNSDMLIEASLGRRIVDVSLDSLVRLGHLVPVDVNLYDSPPPSDRRAVMANQYSAIYAGWISKNANFNKLVLSVNAEWHKQGRTILTLVRSVKHGEDLKKLHNKAGIETEFLSGKDDPEYRQKVLDSMRTKKLRHLVATSIADEGLDLPSLDALNLAAGGKATTRVYQRIGRILRPYEGKERGVVADYVQDHYTLKSHAAVRVGIYNGENSFNLIDHTDKKFASRIRASSK